MDSRIGCRAAMEAGTSLIGWINAGVAPMLSIIGSPYQSISANMPPCATEYLRNRKDCLGQYLTLDPNVPAETGCAEAVSYVLKSAVITDGNEPMCDSGGRHG